MTAEEIDRREAGARTIEDGLLQELNSPELSHLYRVTSATELEAFMWSSLHYDELPLTLLPASCSDSDTCTILSVTDRWGLRSYSAVQCATRWFATVNSEDPDDALVCVATKGRALADEIHRELATSVLGPDRVDDYGFM